MENPPNSFAGGPPASGPLGGSRVLEAWRLAQSARVNVLLMGMPRVNPLCADFDAAIRRVLEILPDLEEPVASWCPSRRLVLHPLAEVRTMILYEVGTLTHGDQLQLLDWLDRVESRTQIVSTTSEPLLPRVRAGVFMATLYYRLNTVCVNVNA